MQTVGSARLCFHLCCMCLWSGLSVLSPALEALHHEEGSLTGSRGPPAGPEIRRLPRSQLSRDQVSCSSNRLWKAQAPLPPMLSPIPGGSPTSTVCAELVPPAWPAKWRDTGSPVSSSPLGRTQLAESRDRTPPSLERPPAGPGLIGLCALAGQPGSAATPTADLQHGPRPQAPRRASPSSAHTPRPSHRISTLTSAIGACPVQPHSCSSPGGPPGDSRSLLSFGL